MRLNINLLDIKLIICVKALIRLSPLGSPKEEGHQWITPSQGYDSLINNEHGQSLIS